MFWFICRLNYGVIFECLIVVNYKYIGLRSYFMCINILLEYGGFLYY